MKFCSQGALRVAAPLAAAVWLLSGCDSQGNRPIPTTEVETIEIPVADVDNQRNTNIDNPRLRIGRTFPVADGDPLTLIWSDEFNDVQLDPRVWFYESGDGTQYGIPSPSFGNNELQYYLPDNVQLADGKLKITAKREAAEGYGVTSGRIMTRDRFAFTYGRIEASIKLPPGQGIWPAFWMLSQDDMPNAVPGFGIYGEYAQSGEIDIVEAVNLKGLPGPGGVGGGNEIFSTIHFGGPAANRRNLSTETRYTPSEDVTAGFHTYAFEWDQFEMRWYFNGILFKVENSWSSEGGPFPAPFDQPFYVLFNLAVGGNFPGPLGATALPATMEVDWVRVYSGNPPPPPDFDGGLVVNGDFEAGTAPWLEGVTNAIGAERIIDDALDPGNSVYFVDVTAAGNASDVNLSQRGLTITPDETYTLTFRARSNVSRTILAGIGLSGGDFSNANEEVSLTTDWQDFSVELTAAGFGDADSRVLFDLGAAIGEVYIDNVRVVVSEGGGEPPFDGGLVTNGDFEAGIPPWLAGVDNPIGMENVIDDMGNNVYFVDVTAAGNASDVNLSQRGITITQDADYRLTFRARSNVARTILAGIGLSGGDFSNDSEQVSLTTDWQDFTVNLTATGFGDADSRVLFDLGAEIGEVFIDDVRLIAIGGSGMGDIASNGGFETGDFTDWALFPASMDAGEQTVVTTNPKTGTYAGRINNTTPGTASIIKQANRTPVAVGQTATITFSARGNFGPGGVAFAEFFEEIDPEGVARATILGDAPLTLDPDPAVWTDFNFVVPITTDVSGGVTLQLTGTTGGAGSFADVYYDDIAIVISD